MNHFIFLILVSAFTLLPSGKKPGKGIPEGLMVEFIRDPSGVPIMDLKPEFTWIVPTDAKHQTSYQYLISTSEEKLLSDNADVWDSGKTNDNRSSEVEYNGPALAANTRYFWKVRIWDAENKSSGYSRTQAFTTGKPSGYASTRNRFLSPLISPVKFEKTADRYFIDFGKDAFGTVILNIDATKADTVVIHLGEKLSAPGMIDRSPGGTIRYTSARIPVTPGRREYVAQLPKDTRNTGLAAVQLPDSFGIITPFRYCEVELFSTEMSPSDIKQKVYHYYFEDDNSSFSSSDTVLNQVWDICKYSMKATSFAGIYVDGDRERIPYEADAYINQLGHYYTDREYSIARLTNEYFIDHPTWPTEWILHTVPMFWNDYMFTGNIESIKNNYERLKQKTLYTIPGDDGLISAKNVTSEIMSALGFKNEKERIRDIVDWPPAQKDTGWKLVTPEGERDGYDMVEVNTVVNAFYYNGLVLMSRIAQILEKKDDFAFFSKEADRVKASFNEKLLDKQKGFYIDGVSSVHSSLHANMMPLAFGLVPDQYKQSVTGFIKTRGMACSVYGAQYLLEGLYRAGEADYALGLMTATHDRSWWNMIRSGLTITLEAWDMKYKPNSDWNHAWGAAPASIIPGFMWGIAPAGPGFSKTIIKPRLAGLKHSTVMVPTIRGNITAVFREKGKKKEFLITIPANMECDFIPEGIRDKAVLLNRKRTRTENGIVKLRAGQNKVSI